MHVLLKLSTVHTDAKVFSLNALTYLGKTISTNKLLCVFEQSSCQICKFNSISLKIKWPLMISICNINEELMQDIDILK